MSETLDLIHELGLLVEKLRDEKVEYALCGGLACACHGHVRATQDIDLLVPEHEVERILEIARTLGYDLEALPMVMGATPITRISKLVGRGIVPLDLLHVTAETDAAFANRIEIPWLGSSISVVAVDGLVSMKRAASRPQDLADIIALTGTAR